jgi:ferritin-like metal-binding protein YciE
VRQLTVTAPLQETRRGYLAAVAAAVRNQAGENGVAQAIRSVGDMTMASPKERLVQWLRDAHAMEEQAETVIGSQVERLEHYPELRARMAQHLEETRSQAKRVEQCLRRLGESTSSLKDAGAKMVAMGQGLSGLFAGDEVMKGSLASYTFEHMEIASYRMLITAAEEVGDAETQRVCQEILREEEAMADWLKDHLPQVTRQYLSREQQPGATSKH